MTGLTFKQTSIAVLLVWLGFSSNVFSQSANSGRDAFDFLKISPIARAVGVGGAYSAIGDDIGSIYYNPAGLASLLTSEVNITYLSLYQNINFESFSFAYPVAETFPGLGGTVAVGVNLLQPGSLARTNDSGVTVNGNATFSSGDQVFTLAYAKAFGSSLHMGFAVNMIQQQVDTVSTSLFDVNVGMVVLPPFDGMRIGVSLQNIGAQESGFNLPFNLNGGISYRRYELFSEQDDGALTAEVTLPLQPIEDPVGIKVGGEYNFKWVGNRITVRAGYEFLNSSLSGIGLALGAGYGFDLSGAVLFLDYAYAPADIFGISNRISLATKF